MKLKHLKMRLISQWIVTITVICLFMSCNTETYEAIDQMEALSLKIQTDITDFAGKPLSETRISINDYTTTFEIGDAIGVIAVEDAGVLSICNNIKLTYSGNGAWAGTVYDFGDDVTYLAYYPYRSDMAGKSSLDEIRDFFPLSYDQSTIEKFKANDLLIARATANSGSLYFSFQHAFSLMEIKAGTYRRCTDGSKRYFVGPYPYYMLDKVDGGVYPYPVSETSLYSAYSDGISTYRLICRESENFEWAYTDGLKSYRIVSPSYGKRKTYEIASLERKLAVGDYFYNIPFKSGSRYIDCIAPGNRELYEPSLCAGIVAYIGDYDPSISYKMVVAITDYQETVTATQIRDGKLGNYIDYNPAMISWMVPDVIQAQLLCSGRLSAFGTDQFGTAVRDKLNACLNKIPDARQITGDTYWCDVNVGGSPAYNNQTNSINFSNSSYKSTPDGQLLKVRMIYLL